MDEGPCPKIHSEIYKTEFERNGDLFMYDHALEREFVNRIAEADRIIKVSAVFPLHTALILTIRRKRACELRTTRLTSP